MSKFCLCLKKTSSGDNIGRKASKKTGCRRTPKTFDCFGRLTEVACAIVRHRYKPGHRYAKAGVMRMDLRTPDTEQLSLQLGDEEPKTRTRLMQALNGINLHHGCGTLHLASAGTAGKQRTWVMKQDRRTPGYTTDWVSIMRAS